MSKRNSPLGGIKTKMEREKERRKTKRLKTEREGEKVRQTGVKGCHPFEETEQERVRPIKKF